MRRLSVVLGFLLLANSATADVVFSSAAVRQIQLGLTQGSLWGSPRYATASLPTCDSTQVGAIAYDTTTSQLKYCTGTSWTIAASGGTSSLTPSQIVVSDSSGNLTTNGTLTTNAIPKSAGSGATLAASSLTDSGTVVTATEPFRAGSGAVGTPTYSFTNANTSGFYLTSSKPSLAISGIFNQGWGFSKSVTSGAASSALVVTTTGVSPVVTGGQLSLCVVAQKGTDRQIACGITNWAAIDTTAGAGGEVCNHFIGTGTNANPGTISAAVSGGASTGTLTVTVDATTGTDTCNIRITATTSLASPDGLTLYYSVSVPAVSAATVTPQ